MHARNIGLVKDLGMHHHVPVIAVAAIEDAALKAQRPVHIEDIFGPIQAQYTPDRVVILNPDAVEDEGVRIRLSLEKNRRGPSELEWRHARVGGQFYLEPAGEVVEEYASFQNSRIGSEEK